MDEAQVFEDPFEALRDEAHRFSAVSDDGILRSLLTRLKGIPKFEAMVHRSPGQAYLHGTRLPKRSDVQPLRLTAFQAMGHESAPASEVLPRLFRELSHHYFHWSAYAPETRSELTITMRDGVWSAQVETPARAPGTDQALLERVTSTLALTDVLDLAVRFDRIHAENSVLEYGWSLVSPPGVDAEAMYDALHALDLPARRVTLDCNFTLDSLDDVVGLDALCKDDEDDSIAPHLGWFPVNDAVRATLEDEITAVGHEFVLSVDGELSRKELRRLAASVETALELQA